ncbi:Nucleoside transporter [Giardia lamblia P15]|uniref:Nucleoside transporter n=1 Tax=Giardia intestinalis (strain P15) TaxID=658858 RepID=E1EYY4_GIAIA|nr:Nucleoside transporter [Giardia lamblia P15]
MDIKQDMKDSAIPQGGGSKTESKTEPKKGCNCTLLYVMFLMFGVGSLLPFNCYITPYEYMTRFYPKSVLSFFSLSYNVGNWGMMFIYLKVGKKLPARMSNIVIFIVWIICLTILPCLAFIDMNVIVRFVIAIILVFISGVLNGICFPKIVSVGSRISFDLVQAMMSGNGVAGIITAALYAITKGIAVASSNGIFTDDQLKYGTLSYFILSDLILLICIFCWIKVMKDYPHLNYDEDPAEEVKMEPSIINTSSAQPDCNASNVMPQGSASLGNETIDQSVLPLGNLLNPKTGKKYTFMQLVRILLVPGLGVFFVFFVTLAFFPSITGKIPYVDGVNKNINDNGWWSVGMTSLFMIFDYVGRSLPQIEVLTRIRTTPLLIFSLLRIVFGVLFLLMGIPIPTYSGNSISKINAPIQNDYVSTITMILFALTNGYVSTVVMIRYGDHVPHPSYMAASGDIMSFWLNTGLIAGGLVSLFIDLGMDPTSLNVS